MGFLGFVESVVVSGLTTNNDQHWSRSAQVYEWVPATYSTFSFFPPREMLCFAVVCTTWAYDDKCYILSSYLWSTCSNLIPGLFFHFARIVTLDNWETTYICLQRRVCVNSLLSCNYKHKKREGSPFAFWPKLAILCTLVVSIETRINSASIHTN
mgnify:CR=1 FL=1